jgi:uncharacterized membrane protein
MRESAAIVTDVTAGSATGFEPHVAAALAYLAGPFSGAIILVAERSNRFVRFHAWQAILGLGGFGLAAVVFLFLAFAGLLLSPSAFTFFRWLAVLTTMAWLVAWALCLFKAFGGAAWKLPLAGDYAERLALRAELLTPNS